MVTPMQADLLRIMHSSPHTQQELLDAFVHHSRHAGPAIAAQLFPAMLADLIEKGMITCTYIEGPTPRVVDVMFRSELGRKFAAQE